jgi:hypothetical protein
MASFIVMRHKEVKGHWPLMKAPAKKSGEMDHNSQRGSESDSADISKLALKETTRETKA